MNLYLLTQNINDDYDTFDSAVVAAEDEETARNVKVGSTGHFGSWCEPKHVNARLIGLANDDIISGTIICASFNAG